MMQRRKSLSCIIVCTITLAHSILTTTLPLVTWVAESLNVGAKLTREVPLGLLMRVIRHPGPHWDKSGTPEKSAWRLIACLVTGGLHAATSGTET